MAMLDTIRPIIEEKLGRMGLDLFDLKFFNAGPGSVLRIIIDKDGGVTIDDCETVSNEISMLLDVEDFSKTPYRLEVSSPGADRALKTEKDFKHLAGRLVKAQVKTDDGKERTILGTVRSCDATTLSLQAESGPVDIALTQLAYAKIELTFK